jgi:hypothetical protein
VTELARADGHDAIMGIDKIMVVLDPKSLVVVTEPLVGAAKLAEDWKDVDSLSAAIDGSIVRGEVVGSGAEGNVYRVRFADGSTGVTKVSYGGDLPNTTDQEVLASKLGLAMGAPVPAVVRVDDTTVAERFVDSTPRKRDPVTGRPKPQNTTRAWNSIDGQRLRVFDYAVANGDRNVANVLLVDDGKTLVGIDHGRTFEDLRPDKADPLFDLAMATPKISAVDVQGMIDAIEPLRPDFEAAGSFSRGWPPAVVPWSQAFDDTTARLEKIRDAKALTEVPAIGAAKLAPEEFPKPEDWQVLPLGSLAADRRAAKDAQRAAIDRLFEGRGLEIGMTAKVGDAEKAVDDYYRAGQTYDRLLRDPSQWKPGTETLQQPAFYKNVAELDKVIADTHTTEDLTAWRGLQAEDTTLVGGEKIVWHDLKPGQIISDKGFVSTSLDRSFSSNWASGSNSVLIEVRLPKGSAALPIRMDFQNEAEALLPRDSQFEVLSVRTGDVPRAGGFTHSATIVTVQLKPAKALTEAPAIGAAKLAEETPADLASALNDLSASSDKWQGSRLKWQGSHLTRGSTEEVQELDDRVATWMADHPDAQKLKDGIDEWAGRGMAKIAAMRANPDEAAQFLFKTVQEAPRNDVPLFRGMRFTQPGQGAEGTDFAMIERFTHMQVGAVIDGDYIGTAASFSSDEDYIRLFMGKGGVKITLDTGGARALDIAALSSTGESEWLVGQKLEVTHVEVLSGASAASDEATGLDRYLHSEGENPTVILTVKAVTEPEKAVTGAAKLAEEGPEWKPVMTSDEADAWIAKTRSTSSGSEIGTFWHGTSLKAEKSIEENGFDPTLRATTGRMYGDGVYLAKEQGTAAGFARDEEFMDPKKGGALMEVRVNLHNVASPEATRDIVARSWKDEPRASPEAISAGWASASQTEPRLDPALVQKLATEEGYDGISTGSSLVVFDPKNIVVIKNPVVEAGAAKLAPEYDAEETHALGAYQQAAYTRINSSLRKGLTLAKDAEAMPGWRALDEVPTLDRAVLKDTTDEPMTVVRWIEHKNWKGKPGQTFRDKAYVSTSRDVEGFTAFDKTKLVIDLPAGTPGVVMNDVGIKSAEDEFLLPRGSVFRVESVDGDGTVHLTYLGYEKVSGHSALIPPVAPEKAVMAADAWTTRLTGDQTYYHTTASYYVPDILKNGLKPSKMGESGPGVYLAADNEYATHMSTWQADHEVLSVTVHAGDGINILNRDLPGGDAEYRRIQLQAQIDKEPLDAALDKAGYQGVSHISPGNKFPETTICDPSLLTPSRITPVVEAAKVGDLGATEAEAAAVGTVAKVGQDRLATAVSAVQEASQAVPGALEETIARNAALPPVGWAKDGTPLADDFPTAEQPHPIPYADRGGLTAADYPSGFQPTGERLGNNWAAEDPESSFERQGKAREALATWMAQTDPAIRMKAAAFKKVLDDGEIRNGFETGGGTSMSAKPWYHDVRLQGEESSLGIPKTAAATERPVYGFLAPKGAGDFLHADNPDDVQSALDYLPTNKGDLDAIRADPDGWLIEITPSSMNAGEGDYIDVVSREYLRTRYADAQARDALRKPWDTDRYATRMPKLRYYSLGDGHGNLNADTVVSYANREFRACQYGDVEVVMKDSTLDMATVTGGDSLDDRLLGVPAKLAATADPRVPIGKAVPRPPYCLDYSDGRQCKYVEVQFADRPQLSDIQKVYFSGAKPTKAITDKLDAAGIEWKWDPAPNLSVQKVPFDSIINTPKEPERIQASARLAPWDQSQIAKQAADKIAAAPVPSDADRASNAYDLAHSKRAGGEKRGNNTDRHRRTAKLLTEFGDGTTCPCVWCGVTLTPKSLTQDKIFTNVQGGRYKIANLLPSCNKCNHRRDDSQIRWVNDVKVVESS